MHPDRTGSVPLRLLPDLRRGVAGPGAPGGNRLARRPPDPQRSSRALALRYGLQPLGARGRPHPAPARDGRAVDRRPPPHAPPRGAVQHRVRGAHRIAAGTMRRLATALAALVALLIAPALSDALA